MSAITDPHLPTLARGRWPAILADLGIEPTALRNNHGPCPGCGGRDRFRFDDKDGRGTFICGQGGDPIAGDGFDLLCHTHGWTKTEAFAAVRRWFGLEKSDLPKPRQRPIPAPVAARPGRDLSVYAREIWQRADRSDHAVAAHPYAQSKRIDWACGAGRATASGSRVGTDADTIVVPIRTPEGELCAVECLSARRDSSGKFLRQSFGSKARGWLALGDTRDPNIPRYVVEGWASAARLLAIKRNCMVAIAFGSSRLMPVALEIEKRQPGSEVIVCAEADHG